VTILAALYHEAFLYLMSRSDTTKVQSPEHLAGLFKSIQGDTTGYYISDEEKKRFSTLKSPDGYGEISTQGLSQLLQQLDIQPTDVVYDLGSGTGKVIFQFFLTTPVKKAVGIELSTRRISIARKSLSTLISSGYISPLDSLFPFRRSISFLEADLFTAPLADATIIYICSNLFTAAMFYRIYSRILKECRAPLRVITTSPIILYDNALEDAPLPALDSRHLVLDYYHDVSVTWTKDPIHAYVYSLHVVE
jgi:SAM-dependent methyltransferase